MLNEELSSITENLYSLITTKLGKRNGLILSRELNGQQTDKIRENIIKVFRTIRFKTEIEINLHEVNFLT